MPAPARLSPSAVFFVGALCSRVAASAAGSRAPAPATSSSSATATHRGGAVSAALSNSFSCASRKPLARVTLRLRALVKADAEFHLPARCHVLYARPHELEFSIHTTEHGSGRHSFARQLLGMVDLSPFRLRGAVLELPVFYRWHGKNRGSACRGHGAEPASGDSSSSAEALDGVLLKSTLTSALPFFEATGPSLSI